MKSLKIGLAIMAMYFGTSVLANETQRPTQTENIEQQQGQQMAGAVMVKIDPVRQVAEIFQSNACPVEIRNQTATTEQQRALVEQTERQQNKIGEVRFEQTDVPYRTRFNSGWNWNRWGGYYGNYNWHNPYYYPGYFNYGYYNYHFGWNYPYNNYYYGWYYP